MPTDSPYTIAELARLTGVNVRTIRYYLAQGLLPASGESGPGAHYGEGHLHRLQLIKRLQAQHQPLSEIRKRLEVMSDADVAVALASTPTAMDSEPTTSALDYIRGVLGAGEAPVAYASARAAPRSHLMRVALSAPADAGPPPPVMSPAVDEAEPESEEPRTIERSQWERISLGPNLELNVRRPLSRPEQKRVERLLTIARQVLKEDKP